MTRETLIYILVVLAGLLLIWFILGGSGAPLSLAVRYSAFLLLCEGGIFGAHKLSRIEEE